MRRITRCIRSVVRLTREPAGLRRVEHHSHLDHCAAVGLYLGKARVQVPATSRCQRSRRCRTNRAATKRRFPGAAKAIPRAGSSIIGAEENSIDRQSAGSRRQDLRRRQAQWCVAGAVSRTPFGGFRQSARGDFRGCRNGQNTDSARPRGPGSP